MDNTYIFIGIATMALITIVLRFIPFIFLNDNKNYSTINYLSKMLPPAIMGMLVIYCLRNISFTSAAYYLPELIASFIVALSYIIKRKTLLSIILGTIIYMVLIQFVF